MRPHAPSIYLSGKELELTRREYDLLYYLAVNRSLTFSREQLLDHVVAWATEVLDEERRRAWAEANATAKAAQKRKPGRPVKGNVVNPEKKDARALKNLRYVLLKNPENLSANQKDQLKFLTKANPRLYRAYLLKEGLRLALKAGSDEISEALTKWMGWAQRCRIPAFRELRLKIKRHFKAIVAAATHGLCVPYI